MLQLRHLQQHVPQYDSGQEVSENQLLAALRFVTSLEHLRQQQPLLTYQTELEEPDQEAHLEAQRQLRAIELTLKALIARAWPDRASLNHYLKQHFGPDRLRQWLKQEKINMRWRACCSANWRLWWLIKIVCPSLRQNF